MCSIALRPSFPGIVGHHAQVRPTPPYCGAPGRPRGSADWYVDCNSLVLQPALGAAGTRFSRVSEHEFAGSVVDEEEEIF